MIIIDESLGLYNFLDIFGFGVADCHGCICFLEEIRNRFPYDIASSQHDGPFPLDVDLRLLEKNHDALRCARDEVGFASALRKLADIDRPKAVDILERRDSRGDRVLRYMFGQRQLDEDSVDCGIIVETLDCDKELKKD